MEAELTESIKEMREGRSDTELSELTGMARGTVWSFMTSAGGPPRIKTLTCMADMLGWEVTVVLSPK